MEWRFRDFLYCSMTVERLATSDTNVVLGLSENAEIFYYNLLRDVINMLYLFQRLIFCYNFGSD